MKLLTKLNIRYILYSLAIMVVSVLSIYLIFSVVINRQMDEQLSGNLKLVENYLSTSPSTILIEPFGTIYPVKKSPETIVYSDTLIYNQNDRETEKYRQITAIKQAGGKYYRIIIRKSKIESGDLLETLAIVTILSMMVLISILILVNRSVARSVWQPFFTNLKILGQFSVVTQKTPELARTGISEFDQMNQVVENLMKKIISDFKNQKQFSEDISHELQTPLAIVSSRIESLLDDPELKSRHAAVLGSIYSSVQRLSKLNKDLILLNKLENNQFIEGEKTCLRLLIVEKIEECNELIRMKNLEIENNLNDDLVVKLDQVLANILINNLLSNCIRHTPERGKIMIVTEKCRLVFCNSGSAEIPYPGQLFTRFYKVDPSSGSPGLGLAIVKKICDLYNISIHYSFSGSFHCFTLKFVL